MKNKPRLLCLLKILFQHTDEDHPISTNGIIDKLKDEYEIETHRLTIAKDIKILQEMDIDVIAEHSKQNQYYIGKRTFELPELKLLIDAVESSKFITVKKSNDLISKIESLTSDGQRKKLKRNNYVVERVKPNNEQIYYIVDAINDAINNHKQISFQYYEYTGLKKKKLRNNGEIYKISPYYMIWSGDYYYVLGHSEKRNKIVTFRVDRIATTPDILEDDAIAKPKDFDIGKFTKSVFFMYDGEKVMADLICDNSLMKVIVDRFGEDVEVMAYDMTSFRVKTEVLASPTFYGWVFGFEGKVEILGPQKLKDEYIKMVKSSYKNVIDNKHN